MTNEQLVARYGMTREELLDAAKRERAMGNTLVAGCLVDAANGNIPKKKMSLWQRIIGWFDGTPTEI